MPICPIMSRPKADDDRGWMDCPENHSCALWVDGGDFEACAITTIAQELMIAREEAEAQAEREDILDEIRGRKEQ